MKSLLTLLWPMTLISSSWIIIADGDPLPQHMITAYSEGRRILVLDGAVNRLKDRSFYPYGILGDFDSIEDPSYWGITATFADIDEMSPSYEGRFGIQIIPAKDQNYTDLEKGIQYCDKELAGSILIVQATGDRMDHTLGNLGLLRKYHSKSRPLILLTEKEQIFYVCDQAVMVTGGVGGTCAIMGYPEAIMTTSGLAYNGDSYPLRMGFQESICNTIIDPEVRIQIEGEALVILPRSCNRFY